MEQKDSEQGSGFKDLSGHVKDFIKAKVAYYKLTAVEGVAKGAANAVMGILLAIFGWLFILFLSIGLAVLIGHALHHLYLGFLIIAGFYLLLAVIIVVFKDKLLITPIVNIIITKMANTDEDKKPENNRPE